MVLRPFFFFFEGLGLATVSTAFVLPCLVLVLTQSQTLKVLVSTYCAHLS